MLRGSKNVTRASSLNCVNAYICMLHHTYVFPCWNKGEGRTASPKKSIEGKQCEKKGIPMGSKQRREKQIHSEMAMPVIVMISSSTGYI